ncbi:MAG: preprotein translocase subunit SecG [Candidatus Moranbacteria bacterium]|nr:preprotein translocase subunit SecG [Candidatus Moranbacteria bacterium]
MLQILSYIQLIIAVLLTASVLMQNRGSGLSAAFGGGMSGFHTKRGIEKFLYWASASLGTLFILNSLASLIISAQTIK